MAETFSNAVVGKRGVPCVNQRSSCLWQKQEKKEKKRKERFLYSAIINQFDDIDWNM